MNDLFDKGMQVRREMFGPDLAERAVATASDFAMPFHDIMTRYCFGETWNRPDLGRRDRSLATLAMLIAQGKELEIKMHVKGGIANGLKVEEIRELVLHAMVYCGVPASFTALRAAEAAIAELEAEVGAKEGA
ncbi:MULTISPECIES: carboxymuconolactone decarboxylase family protein [unclassified Novosphingobium]|uniref:carboxymuconolactone decarboxylase family protein n=1 Tax=unclassified Novosphingobium TaxID=2644732 RepID=UPI00086CF4F1|nr:MULTISPECIES: carboxymuconolactone decarboxylase family protein [unclassified Novosphingobium]MBN9142340.1 carboxymuconolactone decarboxylase family protein [Novosphingobium sp.]ODU77631.1 MAG: 4-carboxymuconolactone decarboxylase [Novosphingobium sp. SCN 63-17]OJX90150.1 MAG: 4-carboxymuconolactone decarboxylase [Novosphingobium sp. 63-713]